MKQYWYSILKLFLFWLLFFAITRGLFLLVYSHLLANIPLKEIVSVFYYALRLDIATACYLITIPLLLFALQLCFKHKITVILLCIITIIELIGTSLILFAEIGIYGEWRSKLNYKALAYLRHPDEIVRTATSSQVVLFILGTIILVVGFYFIFNRFVLKPLVTPQKKAYFKAPISLVFASVLCFVGMRGGIDAIPITQSAAYFSRYDILNDAAVNPHWNIILNIKDFGSLEKNNPFSFMDSEKAAKIVKNLRKIEKDTTISLLGRKNINIVVILLESWTADVIEAISGTAEITPHFNSLAKNGLFFTNFYSNGHRSQQAISNMLSGFPSIPNYDITDNHSKYKHLPSMVDILKKEGYYTSFYFGGNLDYGNIRAFLLHANFDEIIEGGNIDKKMQRGKLGIHDQYMLGYQINKLDKQQSPFFNILFTLSSHSPFDYPKISKELNWKTEELKYLNSVKYTDYCLGQYFETVKNKSWYDNTLFILVADHSHPSHIERSYYETDYQKIPMLWFGNVLKEEFRGTTCDIIGSHADMPETLLSQLNFNTDLFQWGKNMFNPYSNKFVYYEIVRGFGWVSPQGSYTYSAYGDYFHYFTGDESKKDTLLFTGKAYVQKLFETYLSY
jgi:phosphoglycerol transferase MdoB-like AlkP superfamily enzyme